MKPPATPDLMPTLSAGRHRSARQGACFMEFASYLAGERWSDNPACTHFLLAALARDINDLTTNDARDALMPLVTRVIGLTGDDPRVLESLAVRAASAALPIASMERQRALAAGLLGILSAPVEPALVEHADVTWPGVDEMLVFRAAGDAGDFDLVAADFFSNRPKVRQRGDYVKFGLRRRSDQRNGQQQEFGFHGIQ